MTEIRSSILEGDIDKAFKHTTAYYPHVLEDNPEIVFRLKCRKYVEMIRRCSELHTPKSAAGTTGELYLTKANPNANASANGHTDVFDEDMELDDENDNENDSFQTTNTSNGNSVTDEEEQQEHQQHQHHQEEEEEEGDEEEEEEEEAEGNKSHNDNILPPDPTKYDQLLQEAMSYGQTLMREYRDEKREYRKTLEDIFSLIAYPDAKASVHGHLLETGGRVQVAEELNSAILGELTNFPMGIAGELYLCLTDRVFFVISIAWPLLLGCARAPLPAD